MNMLPNPVTARLGKLIGLLASNHDGEIIAAAGAIRRTLQSAGRDLNDLAEHVSAAPQTIIVYRDRPVAPRSYSDWRPATGQPSPNLRFKEMVARCQRLDVGRLSAWEQSFLGSISMQLGQGRTPSPKQATILSNIVAKLEGRS